MPNDVMPGDTFVTRSLLDNGELGESNLWTVDAVEHGGEDPQFYARLEDGTTGRWPVSWWDLFKADENNSNAQGGDADK